MYIRKQPARRKAKGQVWQEDKIVRSGLEARGLKTLNKLQIDYEYEPKHRKLTWEKPSTLHKYLPDVMIGNTCIELKGYWDTNSRLKMKLLVEQHPEIEFIMVFQKDQPIRKGSKTKYSDYCNKLGIKWILEDNFEQFLKQRYKI